MTHQLEEEVVGLVEAKKMVGRKVKAGYPEPAEGTVIKWEPYGHAMNDVLVRYTDGREVWRASHGLKPIDGKGPLPSRREAMKQRKKEMKRQLTKIRSDLVKDVKGGKRWPGMEFGKGHLGMALDRALKEERIVLPKKGDPPLKITAHGKTLTVTRAKSGLDWVLKLPGPQGGRTRWGNKAEALADIRYFRETGALPSKKRGWA